MPKRNITLPPVHNKRAPEQWRIISQYVDFEGRTVLDLGCGWGDLLWRAWEAGALACLGVEHCNEITDICNKAAVKQHAEGLLFAFENIEDRVRNYRTRADIAFCFSVLPYLTDPTATLRWIRKHSTQALIECQLHGDGPGPEWLKCPQDMQHWLDSIGWKSVERIGETVVKERGVKRGIWLCS